MEKNYVKPSMNDTEFEMADFVSLTSEELESTKGGFSGGWGWCFPIGSICQGWDGHAAIGICILAGVD